VLDELELVRREEDRHAARGLGAQDAGQHVGDDRVQPGERLVQHQQVRVVHERGGELHALLIALRELLDPGVGPLGQAEPLQPGRGRAARLRMGPAVQHPEVLELLGGAHLGVQAALLGHVADPLPRPGVERAPAPRDRPAVGGEQAADDPHRRRLAGPVAPDEAEQLAGRHVEAQPVECGDTGPKLRCRSASSRTPSPPPLPAWPRIRAACRAGRQRASGRPPSRVRGSSRPRAGTCPAADDGCGKTAITGVCRSDGASAGCAQTAT
jgi:hypothetical protein